MLKDYYDDEETWWTYIYNLQGQYTLILVWFINKGILHSDSIAMQKTKFCNGWLWW